MRHNTIMANMLLTRFFSATLLCASLVVSAEDNKPEEPRWFQVEMIFFEPVNTSPAGEYWPPYEPITTEQNVTELASPLLPIVVQDNPNIEARAFQLLNPDKFAMNDLAKRLLASRQYRILSHIAWRQPTVELANSTAVHVHNELMQEENVTLVSNEPVILNNLPDPVEQTETEVVTKRFDGTVTVSLSRYLHMKTDINYYNPEVYLAEQIAQQSIDTPSIEHFRLQSSRRMRSKEIHYIDHPYFGIIALITPYQREPEQEPDNSLPAR